MTRDYMIDYRYAHMLPLYDMAARCRVSVYLLAHLEQDDGYVTHPVIARRVAAAYELTDEQLNTMLPPNYRPGKDYDPDKYVSNDPISMPSVKRSEDA